MDLSLKELLLLTKRRIRLIIFMTTLGLVLSAAISRFAIKPSYTSYSLMYVETAAEGTNSDINSLNYAQKIIVTYMDCLNTNKFFRQVIEKSGLDYTSDQLERMSDISAVNNTELFKIGVTSGSPEDSYQLTKVMEEMAPSVLKEINQVAKVQIVDSAFLPKTAAAPDNRKNILIGILFGLIAGFAMALIMEITNTKITDCEKVAQKCKIPFLGDVPYIRRKHVFRRRRWDKLEKRYLTETNILQYEEAYRTVRRNLMAKIRKQGCKKFIICSVNKGAGKSTCAANLGIQLAKTGKRILLVDCDLENGNLTAFFNLQQNVGIRDYLEKESEEKELIQETDVENLKIISCGSEMEGTLCDVISFQVADLIRKLEIYYDCIIFDTASVCVDSSALELLPMSDGMIVVAEQNVTKYECVIKLLTDCSRLNADILGIVVNKVRMEHKK